MMTKTEAVFRAHRQAEIAWKISGACTAVMVGLMLYVWWLHTQLANCYAG